MVSAALSVDWPHKRTRPHRFRHGHVQFIITDLGYEIKVADALVCVDDSGESPIQRGDYPLPPPAKPSAPGDLSHIVYFRLPKHYIPVVKMKGIKHIAGSNV